MATHNPGVNVRANVPTLSWVQTPAHREVVRLIRQRGAPITFREFMETALYGANGYYTSMGTARDGRDDYLTSPQTHPEFGARVARCLQRIWSAMGKPDSFSVFELGCGDGTLGSAVSNEIDQAAESDYPEAREFRNAVRYRGHDIRLDASEAQIPWTLNQDWSNHGEPIHCMLSNELLDSFPVHRYMVRDSELWEIMVDVGHDGKLQESVTPTPAQHNLPQIGRPISAYPDGYILEYSPAVNEWAKRVSQSISRGYILTIDYGHRRDILYRPDRVGGTLRCYNNHVLGSDPFRQVGNHDITSHVDFTLVDESLAKFNFKPSVPLMTQTDFLYCYGYEDAVMNARRNLVEARNADESNQLKTELASLMALSDPRNLGSFKVAIHGRDVPPLPHETQGLTDED